MFTGYWMIAEAVAVAGNAAIGPCSLGGKRSVVDKAQRGEAFLAEFGGSLWKP